jgi:carboxymethylenebutenolidase
MNPTPLQQHVLLQEDARERFAIHVHQPDHADATHAVVLLPAIAGVNAYVAARAAQLARAGYLVAVVDYFSRSASQPDLSTPERIDAAVAAVDDHRVLADVRHVLDWIGERGIDRRHAGVLGFCIGGSYAVLAASEADGPACAVAYYGQLRRSRPKALDPIGVAARLQAPLLGHFGDMDRLIGKDELADFSALLREAQRHHEIHTYAGAPHAFDEWFRPAVFRPVASAEAWRRSLVFLDWHLRGRLLD